MTPTDGMLGARRRCPIDSCPAEVALSALSHEESRRVFGDQQAAVNIDRLANCYTRQALELERQGKSLDRVNVQLAALDRDVRAIRHLKYWIALIVGAIELARGTGLAELALKAFGVVS